MLVNITSKRQAFFVDPAPEEKTPISTPTGTASAMVKMNDEWVGIDASQAWFWTDEWQAGEQEVDEHIRAGEYEEFDSLEEMFESIHKRKP